MPVVVAEHRLFPPEIPLSGIVIISMKLCTIVLQVSMYVGAAVIFNMTFWTMIAIVEQDNQKRRQSQREDIAAYREGVTAERDFHRHGTAEQNVQRNAQEAACSTVATAAPRTPMCRAKIKSGSSRIFKTAPMMTETMPRLENP